VHAYAALMCLAPALEEKRFRYVIPFLLIVFGWSFLTTYRHLDFIVPKPAGFSSSSFMTLLGVYVVTRLARQNGWFEKIPVWILWGLAVVFAAGVFVVPGAGSYNSPVALVWIFVLFSLFLRIRSLGKVEKFVCFIAPSMFGVYLIHCTLHFPGVSAEGYGLIKACLHKLSAAGIPLGLNYVLTIVGVFGISLVVEIARRILLKPLMPRLNAGLRRLDVAYQGFVERVCK
jgi:hypothetical protein